MIKAGASRNCKRSILVSLNDNRIFLREDGNTVRVITEFTTGRTRGSLPILDHGKIDSVRRERMHYSEIYMDPLGNAAAMPFALFLEGASNCAFHGGNPNLESKGCIHLRRTDAEWLFNWAGKNEVEVQIVA